MRRRPPRSTPTYTPFPYTTPFLSRLNIAGQQTQERTDGGVLVLSVGTGHDDFSVTEVERDLAAGIDTERLPDGLGQRDLAFGGQRGNFMNGRHGRSPNSDASMVRNIPYHVNGGSHGVLPSPSTDRKSVV